jgi:hypothetical protein
MGNKEVGILDELISERALEMVVLQFVVSGDGGAAVCSFFKGWKLFCFFFNM